MGSLLGSIGSSLAGGVMGLAGANAQNQVQQGEMQTQENYQTQMSNTAYQRASADMTAAGLNPLMMYGSGGAASTPAGASGTAANVAQSGSSSAQAASSIFNQADLLGGQAALLKAQKVAAYAGAAKNTADAGEKAPWATIGNAISSGLNTVGGALSDQYHSLKSEWMKQHPQSQPQTTPLFQRSQP